MHPETKKLTQKKHALSNTNTDGPSSNLTTAGRVYHDSQCDIQPWAWVVHPYCSA